MTATSGTSPRALRAARRGEALLLHEREHEELGGREENAAPEELAADAAEGEVAGMGSVGAAEAAESEGAPLAETEAGVAAGVKLTVREAITVPEMVGEGTADVTAAASDDGLASPSADHPNAPVLPEEQGRAEEESRTAWGDSPSPLVVAEIAAVVAEAVRRPEGPQSEEAAPTADASAGMTAAAAAANMRGCAQGGSGRQGPGTDAAACAARGKTRPKVRAQPAPRRPGAGLGPGAPGPLLGWLRQGQPPQEPMRPSPSSALPVIDAEVDEVEGPAVAERRGCRSGAEELWVVRDHRRAEGEESGGAQDAAGAEDVEPAGDRRS
ncbi:unnamed protein product [Closterium sp. Naga37s-1]|nr:unnamed protein product [Closterium sp. Naga37s-1]